MVWPVIVLAQFATTTLWFAGNAVLPDLQALWGLDPGSLGLTSSAVQLGFVLGTLSFAMLSIADRAPASRVFLHCAILGAACNLSLLFAG